MGVSSGSTTSTTFLLGVLVIWFAIPADRAAYSRMSKIHPMILTAVVLLIPLDILLKKVSCIQMV